MNFSNQGYDTNVKQRGDSLTTPEFKVADNLKSEFDMWSWNFQEISNLRAEVSRLGMLVRVNNSNSPSFISLYHAHIYSLLIPISVVITDKTWEKVEGLWLKTKEEIDIYMLQRANVPNKKIPFSMIKKLDALYRVSLIVAQKAGLGFKVQVMHDEEKAIERAITIS
jgi:hypothetical protein